MFRISGSAKLLVLTLIFIIPAILSTADTLELSNGDIVSGKIIRMNEDEIEIKTDYGVLKIKRKFVVKGTITGEGTIVSKTDTTSEPVVSEYQAVIPRKGLVCEFLFDNSLLNTSGIVSGLENVNNTVFGPGIDDVSNHAVVSDGNGKYLVLRNLKKIDTMTSFAVSFWVYTDNFEKTQYILSKWKSTDGEKAQGKFAVQTKQGFIACYIVDEKGQYHDFYTEKPFKPGTWNHVVIMCECTGSAGKAVIYLNNETAAEKSLKISSLKTDDSPLYILTAKDTKGKIYSFYNLSGRLDNLRIYDRGLTKEEVAELFREKKK